MKSIFTFENLLHLLKELIWWLLTAMVTYAVLYPVTSKLDFTYWKENAAFIFVALTYFRWSISLKSLPFLRPSWVRFVLFTLNFVLFFYLMSKEQMFVLKLDNFYMEDLGFPKVILYEDVKMELFRYLRMELLLSGTGSLAMIIALQLRLIISYWQFYKHKAALMMGE